ncbi:MAG TPA: elongation factor G [Victivallales bacterium]|nr:elongation factor G [Victivallales bacterium]
MKISANNVRNFSIAGHLNSGKTSLSDLILFKAGKVDRLGKTTAGNSVSDYTPEEQAKQSSIYATALNCEWKKHNFYFTDTPGYGEFVAEPIAAISNSDMALIVVDAVDGLLVGSARAWKIAKKNNVPRAFFVNGMDKETADYHKVVKQIRETYGKTICIPITVPNADAANFSKVVNILRDDDVPEDAEEYCEQIMDTVAESNEELMMRYLDGEKLTEEEKSEGLTKAIQEGSLVPVFFGSVEKDLGIEELMNSIVNLFPTPLSRKVPTEDGSKIEVSETGTGLAKVFKSITDPFLGQLVFFRVYNGTFKSDSEIFNVTKNTKERFGSILLLNGKNQDKLTEAVPGTIGAMVKLKSTSLDNTLATSSKAPELAPMVFPCPIMSYAITAAKSGEEDKIGTGLNKISASDPTVKLERHPETHEMLLSGMGDQHLSLVIKKLKEDSKVEVNTDSPRIPYRETITSNGEGHYRHKKQTGGHGQFAEVYLRVEPNTEGYEFKNAVVGGNIPKNYIPAVEKGVLEAMVDGPLAGCNVENITVTVYDGKFHDVDSSEMAFKIASRAAFRDAVEKSKPILLEPIQALKITIPDQYMGDISGDLNQKRGRILGMGVEEGMQVVKADVPLSELSRYATEVRSITQGNGSVDMKFSRYEMVPSNVAKEIIKNHKKELEEATK